MAPTQKPLFNHQNHPGTESVKLEGQRVTIMVILKGEYATLCPAKGQVKMGYLAVENLEYLRTNIKRPQITGSAASFQKMGINRS